MGGDYVYVGSDGKIYEEREMEDPLFTPSGACFETYTGEQFTDEELDELLSIDIDDRDAQKRYSEIRVSDLENIKQFLRRTEW